MALNFTPKLLISSCLNKSQCIRQQLGRNNWLQINFSPCPVHKRVYYSWLANPILIKIWHDCPCQWEIGILIVNDSNNWPFAVATQVQSRCRPITRGYKWVLNKIMEEADKRQILKGGIVLFMMPTSVVHLWNSPPGKHPDIDTWPEGVHSHSQGVSHDPQHHNIQCETFCHREGTWALPPSLSSWQFPLERLSCQVCCKKKKKKASLTPGILYFMLIINSNWSNFLAFSPLFPWLSE